MCGSSKPLLLSSEALDNIMVHSFLMLLVSNSFLLLLARHLLLLAWHLLLRTSNFGAKVQHNPDTDASSWDFFGSPAASLNRCGVCHRLSVTSSRSKLFHDWCPVDAICLSSAPHDASRLRDPGGYFALSAARSEATTTNPSLRR